MKISKKCNAHAINLPLLNYIEFMKTIFKKSKLYYEEYKDWYEREKTK